MHEDKQLVKQFKQGSRDAFRSIFDKYESDMLSLAKNLLLDKSLAEDVVQDVFISFIEKIDTFHLKGSLKGFLITCVANKARDYLRKAKRTESLCLENGSDYEDNTIIPHQAIEQHDELRQIENAMAILSYEQREVILLHLHEGLTFRNISHILNIPNKTAQSRCRYGLEKLRSLLKNEVEI